ncbi:MAG TPA: NAD(P)-dependent oxidoreductase [Mycobacterium sp.]|jgi:3-hydroxyisobutyrate dehydrogenase-like beta-hydroxyacid dehydrogenase|nr:NAD(P)-dependent oxidoreductase [Mycobacterium sp.]
MIVGFVGLGNMGFPMARRLLSNGYEVLVCDKRDDVVAAAVAAGARAMASPRAIAAHAETVLASLPSLQASIDVATGDDGVAHGGMVRRYVDLSTVGSRTARHVADALAARGIAAFDSPVSGGVAGAEKGTLAVMVSGPRTHFDDIKPVLETIGRPIFVSEKPGAAQTMKLVNNMLAATALATTAEAVVMGVKAGLDAEVMIDVLNAGSGGTHASRDKFPRAVLPRTFDYGFATGLMVKDVRLYLEEAAELGLPTEIATTVGRVWESVLREEGPESDFTCVVKPMEAAAGVIVGEHG